jgi:hypothetical protein
VSALAVFDVAGDPDPDDLPSASGLASDFESESVFELSPDVDAESAVALDEPDLTEARRSFLAQPDPL